MELEPLVTALRQALHPTSADGGECARSFYRYAVGDADAAEAAAFQQHLAGCAACREDLAAYQALPVAPAPAARRAWWLGWPWRGVWRPRRWALGALAAAALLLGVFWLNGFGGGRDPGDAGTPFRIKGPFQLQLAVQRGNDRFTGVSGATFKTGDVLGFFYTAPAEGYLLVLFSDEKGATSLIYPSRPPVKVPPAVVRPLPDGAVLEPGRGCEWIVAFFSQEPWPVQKAERLLRQSIAQRGPDCALPAFDQRGLAAEIVVLRRNEW